MAIRIKETHMAQQNPNLKVLKNQKRKTFLNRDDVIYALLLITYTTAILFMIVGIYCGVTYLKLNSGNMIIPLEQIPIEQLT